MSNIRFVTALLLTLAAIIAGELAHATENPEAIPETVGFVQKLDGTIDRSLLFRDQDGSERSLGSFLISGRPAIIAPVYFECPRLCTLTLAGVQKLVNELELGLGQDYKILAVTIDPEESAELAKRKAERYYEGLNDKEHARVGWEFLTSTQPNIAALMDQLGFLYKPDGAEYSHSAGIVVITPEGKISRYFFGIEYPESDVRYSLIEASQGRIGQLSDHLFLYCFRFDPTKGKYTLAAWNLMRIVCMGGVVALAGLIITLRVKENGGKTSA